MCVKVTKVSQGHPRLLLVGRKMENRKMDCGKHKEVKLVHEVKMEVYSRDEARHTAKSDL